MECKFVVGQKVTPINDGWRDLFTGRRLIGGPKTGAAYTVGAISVFENMPIIQLKEPMPLGWWAAKDFRPLHDRPKETDTDISVFYPHLATTGPWGAPAPADMPVPVKAPELEPAT